MNLERSKIERIQAVILEKKLELKGAEKNMSCYKNQFKRISDNEKIDLNFCNTK